MVEGSIMAAGQVTNILTENDDAEEMLRKVLSDFDLEILEKSPIEYRCFCSRERMERALVSLGPEELKAMIDEQGDVTLTCQFCDSTQHFSKEELEALLESMRKKDEKI